MVFELGRLSTGSLPLSSDVLSNNPSTGILDDSSSSLEGTFLDLLSRDSNPDESDDPTFEQTRIPIMHYRYKQIEKLLKDDGAKSEQRQVFTYSFAVNR
jgi:hypothetical protein